MVFHLRGLSSQLRIDGVANVVNAVFRGFYANVLGHAEMHQTEAYSWLPQDVVFPLKSLPPDPETQRAYEALERTKLLPKLVQRASEFALTVKSLGRFGYESLNYRDREKMKPELAIRVFDKTLVSDLASYQILPPSHRVFLLAVVPPAELKESNGSQIHDSGRLSNFKYLRGENRTISAEKLHADFSAYLEAYLQETQRRIDALPATAVLQLLSATQGQ